LTGESVEIHLKFSVVVGDGVGLTLFEYAAGATYYQFAALLQKLGYFVALEFCYFFIGNLLYGFVNFIEVGHLRLYPDLFDCTAMAAFKGVDSIE